LYPATLQCEGNFCSLGYCKNKDELDDGVAAQEGKTSASSSGEAGKQDAMPAVEKEDPRRHELKVRSASSTRRTRGTKSNG
jgi:hypothetical protein